MSQLASDEDKQAVGERLARLRIGLKLNQVQFAAALGVPRRSYINYERGEREVPLWVLRAVHDVYGIDPVWVMSGPGDMPQPVAARTLDFALLQAIVERIDEQLSQLGKSLPPERRRCLIETAYAQCSALGKFEGTSVDRLVLVAA